MRQDSFDSNEELYFSWWVEDMIEARMIAEAEYQPNSIEICPKQTSSWDKQLKTKVKTLEKTVLQPLSYTADWRIRFSHQFMLNYQHKEFLQSNQRFHWLQPDPVFIISKLDSWWVDVKGDGSMFNDSKYFNAVQKMLYHTTGIYAQKVVICNKPARPATEKRKAIDAKGGFFERTFTPKRYLLTDKSMKPRKIHYPVRTLQEWLEV